MTSAGSGWRRTGPTASGCVPGPWRTADRADPVGLVAEGDLEVGEVGLGLLAGGRLEAAFEAGLRLRAYLAQEVVHGGVAEFGDLPPQAPAGQARMAAIRSRR